LKSPKSDFAGAKEGVDVAACVEWECAHADGTWPGRADLDERCTPGGTGHGIRARVV